MANVQAAAQPRRFELDPMRWLWRVLTSVRFALAIIAFLAAASLAGVLIPQLPIEMKGNPAAVSAWLDFQQERFGFLTEPMHRLGLFDVFRSVWFVSGLGMLVASVCVCTANRLPPVWRNVTRPQTRVPDEYLEHGQPAVAVAAPDVVRLTTALRRRRYRVSIEAEGDATYVFADRYPWAQFATFVSHLALILFLAGGLVTVITAKEYQVFAAEGEPGAPVFGTGDRDHMQVYVEDAVGRFDATGFPLDFRSAIVVYRGGGEVARGVITVNGPLEYGGFRFHQSAYFPDGAALRVREAATGRLVYDEVLALTGSAATPRVVVRDARGAVLVDDAIVPTDFIGDAGGTLVTVPGTNRDFWVGARRAAGEAVWQLIVFETGAIDGTRALIAEGEKQDLAGLTFAFAGMTSLPSTTVSSLPGVAGDAIAELSKGPRGPSLTIGPVERRALALSPGEPVVLGAYEYSFAGQREFAGITVRKDHGATFIWAATGLFLAGLALTFYTPRRRLWGKITAGQAVFRGLGGLEAAIEREIREVTGNR